jgi:hypothetical protein
MRTDDVARLSEQSTLGALMLHPEALDEVRRWLRPDDFADTWHAQVYAAMLERQGVGGLDPNSMAAVLVDRLGLEPAHLPRFADLLHATPPLPQPLPYARMVLDAGLRREAAGLGILLQAAALATTVDHSARPLTATCLVVDAGLDVVAGRWDQAGGLRGSPVVVPLHLRAATANTGATARLAAEKYLTAHPPRDLGAEREHVIALVGTLVAHPDLIGSVAEWLTPNRIADPAWRLIYGATIELAELGQQVDLTTVAWAVHAHAHHGPALPSLEELRGVVDAGWYAHPPEMIRTVACDQARAIADLGAAHLRTGAANPGVLVTDLVDAGHTITAALRTISAALPAQADRPDRDVARSPIGIEAVSR